MIMFNIIYRDKFKIDHERYDRDLMDNFMYCTVLLSKATLYLSLNNIFTVHPLYSAYNGTTPDLHGSTSSPSPHAVTPSPRRPTQSQKEA
jgi:hypothetical protein